MFTFNLNPGPSHSLAVNSVRAADWSRRSHLLSPLLHRLDQIVRSLLILPLGSLLGALGLLCENSTLQMVQNKAACSSSQAAGLVSSVTDAVQAKRPKLTAGLSPLEDAVGGT